MTDKEKLVQKAGRALDALTEALGELVQITLDAPSKQAEVRAAVCNMDPQQHQEFEDWYLNEYSVIESRMTAIKDDVANAILQQIDFRGIVDEAVGEAVNDNKYEIAEGAAGIVECALDRAFERVDLEGI